MANVIPDDVARQMFRQLIFKVGGDETYPGFDYTKIATIAYDFSEGTGNTTYAWSLLSMTLGSMGRNALNEAEKVRKRIDITLTLTNGMEMVFICNFEPEADGRKFYKCVETNISEGAWGYIMKNPSRTYTEALQSTMGKLVGRYVDTGKVELLRYGGYRKRKTGNNRRQRQIKTRKARRF